ncbi:MAG: T9SS type A sorting domain-containing protein [Bacteroidota bacterium]
MLQFKFHFSVLLLFLLSLSIQAQIGEQRFIEPIDPTEIITGDLDGDNREDILAVSPSTNHILWRKNLGDTIPVGEWQLLAPAVHGVSSVRVLDWDEDGDQDVLAVVTGTDNRLILFRNTNGQGDFTSRSTVFTSPTEISAYETGDIDNDGDQDVILATEQELLLLKLEDATLAPSSTINTLTGNASVKKVTVADLNGDNYLDLCYHFTGGNQILWHPNLTAGNFAAAQTLLEVASSDFDFAAVTINDDTLPDVVVTATDLNRIDWYQNENGQILAGSGSSITADLMGVSHLETGDVDNDGHTDLVVSRRLQNDHFGPAFFLNNGSGSFTQPEWFLFYEDQRIATKFLELNGDSAVDLYFLNTTDNSTYWMENAQILGDSPETRRIDRRRGARFTNLVDIDQDGDQDVVSISAWGGLAWYENLNGNGVFSQRHLIGSNPLSNSFSAADVNGDGYPDILIPDEDNGIYYYPSLGEAGQYGGKTLISAGDTFTRVLSAGDFDGDGDIDVVAGGLPQVVWFKNEGNSGEFSSAILIGEVESAQIETMVVADRNQDGDLDIFLGTTNQVFWLNNTDGQGNFEGFFPLLPLSQGADAMLVTDLDGDGDLDVVYVDSPMERLLWRENLDGSGSLGNREFIDGSIGLTFSIASGDIDSDGDTDLFLADFWKDEIVWYENINGDATEFVEATLVSDLDEVFTVAVGPIDADSAPDLLYCLNISGEIAWFRSNAFPPTSTEDAFQSESEGLRVFPNPASDHIFLQSEHSKPQHCQWAIYSVSGQLMLDGLSQVNADPINITNLPPGTYIIRIRSSMGQEYLKFVKGNP